MKYQQYIIDETRKAADELFRYAAATPQDKLEWKPLDAGRSVLDQIREAAKCPDWAHEILISEKHPEWDEAAFAEQRKEMDTWKSVEQCRDVCMNKLDRLFELYGSISDEQLTRTKWLRYNGGRDHTYAEMMDYPRWNFTYHVGQIGFIQTLLGDKEMH